MADDLHDLLINELYQDKEALREALGSYWDLRTMSASNSRTSSEFTGIVMDIDNAIKSLPEDYQRVVILNLMAGFPTSHVAEVTGKPRSTVIGMVNRALDGIQAYLEGKEHGIRSRSGPKRG
jgi:DNA-directed RNA polymerase specialized sigma24 family protein